jgi:serpin B
MKILKSLFFSFTAVGILLSACIPVTPINESMSDTPVIPPTQPDSGPLSPSNIAQSNIKRDTGPSAPAGDIQTLVNGNNAFAIDLYQLVRGQGDNIVFSPYSISLALAMTYAGARSATESQMADVLHFTLGQNGTHPAFNALDLKLAQLGESPAKNLVPLQLNIANAVWAEQTYPFQQNFLDTIALNYGSGIHLADFINQFEPVRKEINRWVEDQTKDKIKDLLSKGTLNSATRMVLVNAIYFKADWFIVFDPNKTQDAPFHLLDGSEAQVKMMSNDLYNIPYTSGDGYQAVELPYMGGTAAMDILVPDEGRFSEFEAMLDAEKLDGTLNSMQPTSVQLGLPKFQFTSQFSLSDQLSALGMPDAFAPNRADFSGMTGNQDLFISDVIHKAFVAVDEKGTEAAAATAVSMQMAMQPSSQIILTIDRPFIFIIRDKINGQILFMGRVVMLGQ